MAIDSVSSSNIAQSYQQMPTADSSAGAAKRLANQDAEAAKAAEQRKAEQVQREQQAQQAQQTPPPKPVVNTQGQVTGQLLNEIA